MADLQVRLKYKKSEADDWTKVEDKALRKKIQNRLAKRKCRTSGAQSKGRQKSIKSDEPKERYEEKSEDTGGEATPETTPETTPENFDHSPPSDGSSIDVLNVSTAAHSPTSIDSIDGQVQDFFVNSGLSEHRFLCLTQYSLMRALIQNSNLLRLDPLLFHDDDAVSPWTLTNPYPGLAPHDLSPTAIQLCTPHHPYLDLLAPAEFRDNVLLALLDDDLEDQLCYEIHLGSFTVWGSQPWNSMAWEINQAFATNWAWLLSDEMIRATNFWRGERGEAALVLPEASEGVLEEVF